MTREVALPKKAWIGTFEWPVSLVEPAHEYLRHGKDNGTTDTESEDKYHIYINNSLPLRKLLEIVLHELEHAFDCVYGVKSKTKEEDRVRIHGEAWSAFWIDNPKFQRWHANVLNRIWKERKDA